MDLKDLILDLLIVPRIRSQAALSYCCPGLWNKLSC